MPHLARAWEARVLLRLRQPQGEAAAVGALALPLPEERLQGCATLGGERGAEVYVPCSLL